VPDVLKNKMDKKPVSSDLYDKEYYEKYNHGYSSFTKSRDLMPDLYNQIKDIDLTGMKILDVGCGRGELIRYAVVKGAEAYGIDYSDAAIEIAKDIVVDLPEDIEKRAYFETMDAKELKFENDFFDYVFLFDIVEHLHDWELKKCLSEVSRVLKPGGKVIVHTSPNKNLMNLVRVVARPFGVNLKSSEFHVNEQTPDSLNKYMSENFHGKLYVLKDKHYWINQMDFRGNLLKTAARITDTLFDNPLIHNLCLAYPFNKIFTTDIWYKGAKKLN
jgi:cyclopropane fatty-acyl-phospholipid synthase-like methyltransferase